jgi:hypothetical protein
MKVIGLLLLVFMVSCKPTDTTKSDFLSFVQKGKINTKVICKADQTLSYSLYLPSNYNLKNEFGIVYCFDPKGDGSLPLSLLTEIAEKNAYILVGSNDSKNGLNANELMRIVDILITDTHNKLMIDNKRIYYFGFSGGARVAASTALTYGNAAGVICCSAGFKPSTDQKPFNFIGIAGNDDMNYMEVKNIDSELSIWPTKHQFIEFDGKHKWPSKQILDQAFSTLELYAMQAGSRPVSNDILQQTISNCLNTINKLQMTGNTDSLAHAYKLLANTLNAVNGLADISKLVEKQTELFKNTDLQKFLKFEKSVEENESNLHQNYMKKYTTESLNWWKLETQQLNNRVKSSSSSIEMHSSNRSLAFISLMSFSYVNSALSQRNWEAAEHYLNIYGYADSENPDYLYFSACLYANIGKQAKAIEYLSKALASKNISIEKAKNDILLANIRETKQFNELVETIQTK